MTSSQLPLAIIQLERPPTPVRDRIGEQARWFIDALALAPHDYQIYRPDTGEALPDFNAVSGAILSGSWAMVTDHAEWSERTAAWLRAAMEQDLPLLGVCYGHQLMAYALGGEVGDNPRGWERGALPITLQPDAQDDALLQALPSSFPVWLSHRQTVLTPPPARRCWPDLPLMNARLFVTDSGRCRCSSIQNLMRISCRPVCRTAAISIRRRNPPPITRV